MIKLEPASPLPDRLFMPLRANQIAASDHSKPKQFFNGASDR
jgi:hypothetical protein